MAHEIAGTDDILVFGVDPRGPSIHMPDFDLACTETAEKIPHFIDLPGQCTSVCVAAVEIFAADADGDDP